MFEIHGLLISRQATKALALLEDILGTERPEALIGLFARKLRDMYKTKVMLDAGFGYGKIAASLGMRSFVVEILVRECKRFSQAELREALKALADLDYMVKSGEGDAGLALPEALVRIYKL